MPSSAKKAEGRTLTRCGLRCFTANARALTYCDMFVLTRGDFKRTLLAGHEFDLSLLNALTYALFDTFFENSYIAVFATYVLELLVRFARRELARLNIAKKTLMDDRFLL